MKRVRTADMVITAVFSALIAVFSQLAIPSPFGIPITLQTFIIALTSFSLGWARAATAVLVYIAVGAVGIPVFAGFQGGLGTLFGMTGGFIFGFIPMTLLCGICIERRILKLALAFLGLLICHICGVLWFSFYSESIKIAFLTASAPYLVKDIVSVTAAMLISGKAMGIVQKFN